MLFVLVAVQLEQSSQCVIDLDVTITPWHWRCCDPRRQVCLAGAYAMIGRHNRLVE